VGDQQPGIRVADVVEPDAAEEPSRRDLITFARIITCAYRDRARHYLAADGRVPIALKARNAKQEEVRFAWFPSRRTESRYLDVTIPELKGPLRARGRSAGMNRSARSLASLAKLPRTIWLSLVKTWRLLIALAWRGLCLQ
jgi:hypothetical protein